MSHTPSAPKVNTPASATDPRYSTSGILNAQLKEKNRQGLLSTYGGRSGATMNINKFAEAKINMRDPSAVSALETLSRLYGDAISKSKAHGVTNSKTSNSDKATANIQAYNESVDAVDNYLKNYNIDSGSGFVKANEKLHDSDPRTFHGSNYAAKNKKAVKASVSNVGASGEVFNQVAENIKKQKQAAKQ